MAGTTWPNLVGGRKALASEVEAKFDWLEQHIYPMLSGSTTDLAYDLGSESARWRSVYVGAINPTSTAGGVAIGTATVDAGAILELAGTKAFILPRLSSTQRDNLTGREGMLIFNSTTSQLQLYRSGAWGNVGGTLFQQKAATSASTNTGATATAVNVTGGGGRINGIGLKAGGAAGADGSLHVVLDGVTVISVSVPTTTAQDYVLDATGILKPGSTTAAPFLGLDFLSTAVVYINSGPNNQSVTVNVLHALIA